MGQLKKYRDWPGVGTRRSVILVPGVSASTLEQQTCSHFPEFIESCYAVPGSPLTVWVFNHGVTPRTRECWDTFIAAGEQLLKEILLVTDTDDEMDLVLIGHRLGVFLLKRALVLADRTNNHPGPKALFEALQKIIMIGDPDLHDENRQDWACLVQECVDLPKKLSSGLFSEDALDGLRNISTKFDNVTVHSRFFQVSGKASQKRRLLRLRANSTYKSCLCGANIGVRMWTTADEEEVVPLGEGETKACVFHQGSNCREPLQRITGGEYDAFSDRLLSTAANTTINSTLHAIAPSLEATQGSTVVRTCEPVVDDDTKATTELAIQRSPATEESSFSDMATAPEHTLPSSTPGSCSISPVDNPGHMSSSQADLSVALDREDYCIKHSHDTNRNRIADLSDEQSELGTEPPAPRQELGEDIEVVSENENLPNSARRSRPLPLQLHIPRQCDHFVARNSLLESLRSFLLAERASSPNTALAPKQSLAILHGVGGIGKTEIAKEFAIRHQAEFDSIFWIRSDSQASIARSLHDAAIALHLINGRKDWSHQQSTAACLKWFEQSTEKWLLIFDNVEDPEVVKAYIPISKSGSIILTTRQPVSINLEPPGSSVSVIDLEVPTLTPDESVELVQKAFQGHSRSISTKDTMVLVALLEGYPVALEQAATYISSVGVSMHQYIDDFKAHSRELSDSSNPEVEQGTLSEGLIHQITSIRNLSDSADDMCSVLACLDPADMDESLLLAATACELPLRNLPKTRADLSRCASETSSLGFTRRQRESRLYWKCEKMQDAYHSSMPRQQRLDALETTSLLLLSRWPSRKKTKNILLGFWPEFDHLHTHVRRLSRLWVSIFHRPDSWERLSQDKSFTQLLTRSIWYNANIRGNGEEDLGLQDLAHTLYDRKHEDPQSSGFAQISSHVPSRLLFIDQKRKQCRLIDTNGKRMVYMALSHCWSQHSPLPKLTSATEKELKAGISFAEIHVINSASFFMKHAGVEYLWIDAMCMMQNNMDDMNLELTSLADTYANSMATIVCAPIEDHGRLYSPSKRARTSKEQSLSPRRIYVGGYTVRCHGSDGFRQDWFSRIATSSIRPDPSASGNSPAFTSPTPSRWAPSASHSRVHSNGGSLFIDLPGDLPQELHDKLLPPEKGSCQPVVSTTTAPECYLDEKSSGIQPSGNEIGDTVNDAGDAQSTDYTERTAAQASGLFQEAISYYERKDTLQAVWKLFRVRESVSVAVSSSQSALRSHLLSAVYLATIYLENNSLNAALEILSESKHGIARQDMSDPSLSVIVARLFLTGGNIYAALGANDDAIELYRKAAGVAQEDSEAADFVAIAKLKLSRLKLTSNVEEAHNLVKESITHFEVQETTSGQAQYARALYYRALIFGAEGREKLRKRSMQDARRALEDVCDERGLPVPPDRDLVREDFEGVLGFGYV